MDRDKNELNEEVEEKLDLPANSEDDSVEEAEEILDYVLEDIDDPKVKSKVKQSFQGIIAKFHRGPFPPASELQAYQDVSPEILDKIMGYISKEQENRHYLNSKSLELEEKELDANTTLANKEMDKTFDAVNEIIRDDNKDRKRGFYAAFGLSLFLLVILGYAVYSGYELAALGVSGSFVIVVALLITNFLKGRKGLDKRGAFDEVVAKLSGGKSKESEGKG
jgi:uncharacterized membrane protein